MVLPADTRDDKASRVRMAAGPEAFGAALTPPVIPMYTAQAEFYFDCDDVWNKCNDNEHAMFSLRWRVRLRRVHSPAFLKDLVDWGTSAILSGGVTDWLKARVKDCAVFDKAKGSVQKVIGEWGADTLFGWIVLHFGVASRACLL